MDDFPQKFRKVVRIVLYGPFRLQESRSVSVAINNVLIMLSITLIDYYNNNTAFFVTSYRVQNLALELLAASELVLLTSL